MSSSTPSPDAMFPEKLADVDSSPPDSGISADREHDGTKADNNPDLVDIPKIVTTNPDSLVYSSLHLHKIRESVPEDWPAFLDETFKNSRGLWDLDRWHQNRKQRGVSPTCGPDKERSQSSLSAEGKPKNPKDRVKAEHDIGGLVLSPQRRSFLTGCQVTASQSINSKMGPKNAEDESESGKPRGGHSNDQQEHGGYPQSGQRRVGSGRLMNRNLDEEYPEQQRRFDRYGFNRNNEENGGLDDRRNLVRKDRDQRRLPDHRGGYGYRDEREDAYNNRRNPSNARGGGRNNRYPRRSDTEDEPEWMSAPIEQGDMMELRGFDDSPEKPEPQSDKKGELAVKKSGNNGSGNLDFDDLFSLDSIPGLSNLLTDEKTETSAADSNPIQQSRFSRFFQQQQQPHEMQSEPRRSSIQDDIGNTMRRINDEPNICIPSPGDGNSNCYFAPISPAAKTNQSKPNHDNHSQQQSLMHLLRMHEDRKGRGNISQVPPALGQLQGKNVKSVGGLGANLRQMAVSGNDPRQQQQERNKANEGGGDLSAFNKFAAMVNANPQNDLSVLSKLNPQQSVPPNQFSSGILRPNPISANELEHMAAFSQRRPNARHFGHQHVRPEAPDILNFIHRAPYNLEVLQRPEAHNLIKALEQGDATHESLIHQFCSGSLPKLHSEIVLNVLKVQQSKGHLPSCSTRPPMASSNSPIQSPMQLQDQGYQQQMVQQHPRLSPGMMQAQQQQQTGNKIGNNLAVSPTSGQQRIPSPQELVYHTQQIMQNALIRRKLEEQKENYRKKNELNDEDPVPSSLNFTPTVVMKGLAAERRDSDPRPQVPELRLSASADHAAGGGEGGKATSPSNGRPALGGAPMMQHVPLPPPNAQQLLMMQQSQQQQQQHSMQQQALQMAAIRGRIQDPRLSQDVPNMNLAMAAAAAAQQQPGGQGGLSQFFSQEMLAQVQAGNAKPMPPLPTQKAMTLEELECQAAASH